MTSPHTCRLIPVLWRRRIRPTISTCQGGAYSTYNWELFFHIPLLIARGLMETSGSPTRGQWLHYVFDPIDASRQPAPQKYWQTGACVHAFTDPQGRIGRLADLDLLADPAQIRASAAARNRCRYGGDDPSDPDGSLA